jgi:glycosyltransferase involved in cell wall biosynthesis
LKVLSIHWGFSYGGIAKYAATFERVCEHIPLKMRSLCLLPNGRVVDRNTLATLDAIVLPIRSVMDLSWISKVRRIINDETPDYVLSHGFNGHLVSLLGCIGQCNIKRLATYHGNYHHSTAAKRMVEPIYNAFTQWFIARKAISVLVVAQFWADFFVKRGVDARKIKVVHNGIPDLRPGTEWRSAIRREWGFSPQHVVIGIASRLEKIKGLDYLIEAFVQICREHEEGRLVLIGDGSQRHTLQKLSASKGIAKRVLFTGMRSDVSECMTAIDIFSLPSLSESHSIGLIEAMRAGRPIIATNVGGNTETVRDGREGMIVRPADEKGLAGALNHMISDEALRARLGAAARKRFTSEFTEEVMLAKTAQWLQRLCWN